MLRGEWERDITPNTKYRRQRRGKGKIRRRAEWLPFCAVEEVDRGMDTCEEFCGFFGRNIGRS